MLSKLIEFIVERSQEDTKNFVSWLTGSTSGVAGFFFLPIKVSPMTLEFGENMVRLVWALITAIVVTTVSYWLTELFKTIRIKCKTNKEKRLKKKLNP